MEKKNFHEVFKGANALGKFPAYFWAPSKKVTLGQITIFLGLISFRITQLKNSNTEGKLDFISSIIKSETSDIILILLN